MDTKKTLKLIDGLFSEADARGILLQLISSKLNFHSLKRFSDQEKFGLDTMQSELRIKQLKELEIEVRAILDEAKSAECVIKIKSDIEISITPKTNKK